MIRRSSRSTLKTCPSPWCAMWFHFDVRKVRALHLPKSIRSRAGKLWPAPTSSLWIVSHQGRMSRCSFEQRGRRKYSGEKQQRGRNNNGIKEKWGKKRGKRKILDQFFTIMMSFIGKQPVYISISKLFQMFVGQTKNN